MSILLYSAYFKFKLTNENVDSKSVIGISSLSAKRGNLELFSSLCYVRVIICYMISLSSNGKVIFQIDCYYGEKITLLLRRVLRFYWFFFLEKSFYAIEKIWDFWTSKHSFCLRRKFFQGIFNVLSTTLVQIKMATRDF